MILPTDHRPTSRVLDILQLLSTSKEGYTPTEISIAINVPKSTITPILRTLLQRKFITLNKDSGKYVIGIAAFVVGYAALPNLNLLELIKGGMKKIVTKTSETCQLGILVDGDVLYIAKEESPEPIRLISFVGNRLPAYATGIGKALLSAYSLSELKSLYPLPLQTMTPYTVKDIDTLFHELEISKRQNFFIEKEENSLGIICLSVPLIYQGKIVAAISVSIPKFRFTPAKEKIILKSLQTSRQNLEHLFHELNIDSTSFLTMLTSGMT